MKQVMLKAWSLFLVVAISCINGNAVGEELCEELVASNSVTVGASTLQDIENRGATFQDLIDCLGDDGRVIFNAGEIMVGDTIYVRRRIQFLTMHGPQTWLICSNRPIFDVRAAAGMVEMRDLAVRDCAFDHTSNSNATNSAIVVRSGARVTFRSVRFVNNTSSRGPAVIDMKANSTVTVIDSYFDRNNGGSASVLEAGAGCQVDITRSRFRRNRGRGGAVVLVDSEQLDVSDCNFTNNVATHRNGGAIHIQGEERETTVTIKGGSKFEGNEAEAGHGGALSVLHAVSLTIDVGATFRRNSAALTGGAMFVRSAADVTIDGGIFLENSSNFIGGGAIFVESSEGGNLTLLIGATLFLHNVARNYLSSGGALRIRGGNVRCNVSNSTIFSSNQAELDGGAMHVSDVSSLAIVDSSFIGNEALSGEGAALSVLFRDSFSTDLIQVEVLNSTFAFNRAMHSSRGGGAVGMTGIRTEAFIADCLFIENDGGEGSGGALYFFNGPSSTIAFCEFVRNRAGRGGAIFAQRDVRLEVRNSRFDNNTASEGGAVHTRNGVDLSLIECALTNNSARTEGGALNVQDSARGTNERSFVVLHNCTFAKNQAGSNLIEDALFGTETSGGGVLLFGNRIDVEIRDSNFTQNEAYHGGAINIEAVAECNIAGKNAFSRNRANLGGGIFMEVDEDVQPIRYDKFLFEGISFIRNEAEEGGGVYVRNTKVAFGDRSINAYFRLLRITTCVFENNRARRSGGAASVAGAGVEFHDGTVFRSNSALEGNGRRSQSRGGAIRVETGAVVELRDSLLESNSANVGGAISLFDASLGSYGVDFLRNRAILGRGGGVGGALSLEVSHDKDIPILNTDTRFYSMIFGCSESTFVRNFATLRGGAIYLHHINPGANISVAEECDRGPDTVSCISRQRYLNGLNYRSAPLHNTSFLHNVAQVGGAIFTNDIRMINASVDLRHAGRHLAEVWENQTYLEESLLLFENNSNNVPGHAKGYGVDFATTPRFPLLTQSHQENGSESSDIFIEEFSSGNQLNFTISFRDAIGQEVVIAMNLVASVIQEASSEDEAFELSGQLTAEMNSAGKMTFTATRVKAGQPGINHTLRIDYEPNDAFLTYLISPSFIVVNMKPCRIGERTVVDGNVTECQTCLVGAFGKYPEQTSCTSCADVDNGNCNGDTVVPNKGYWHSTSTSLKIYRCIGTDSCDFDQRAELIQRTALERHTVGEIILYMNESDDLCRTGYRGPLCGSCSAGYGRLDLRCRNCGEAATQHLVLILVVIGTVAFVSYFVEAVHELPQRMEFNRRFQDRLPVLRNRLRMHSQLAEAEGTEPLPAARVSGPRQNAGTQRTKKLRKRLAAIIFDNRTDIQLLTLANPATEVLKIIINFLQDTAAATSIAVRWTVHARKLFVALGVCGNITAEQNFLSLDCFMHEDDEDKAIRRMTVTVLQPVMFFCFYFVVWAIIKIAIQRNLQSFGQRVHLTYLAINYFAYISMTKNLLRFLACANISDIDIDESQRGHYWQEDTAVKCYDRNHGLLVNVMAVPLLCVVTLGFPFGVAFALYHNKHRLDNEDIIATYGFLYSAYNRPYWEVVITLRKAAIAAVSVFAHFLGPNLQALLCIFVLIFALSLQLNIRPFAEEVTQLNRLEAISLSCTVVVFVIGLMMNDPQTNSGTRVFLTAVIYLVVFGALGIMIMELTFAIEEFVDMKILQHELMSIPELIDSGLFRKWRTLVHAYLIKFRSLISDVFVSMTRDRSSIRESEARYSTDIELSPSVSERYRRLKTPHREMDVL